MLQCRKCESPKYLKLTERGNWTIRDGEMGEIDERYICTQCGGAGRYFLLAGAEQFSGVVEQVEREEPGTTNA